MYRSFVDTFKAICIRLDMLIVGPFRWQIFRFFSLFLSFYVFCICAYIRPLLITLSSRIECHILPKPLIFRTKKSFSKAKRKKKMNTTPACSLWNLIESWLSIGTATECQGKIMDAAKPGQNFESFPLTIKSLKIWLSLIPN